MAQTVSVLVISNDEFEVVEVLGCIPSNEDVESLALSNDIYGNVECDYVSYNIGEGESGMDTFFSDSDLTSIFHSGSGFGEFEGNIEKEGYSIDSYHSGTLSVYVEEV